MSSARLYLPFDDPVGNLEDIFEHIGHIEEFLDGMSAYRLCVDIRKTPGRSDLIVATGGLFTFAS